MKFEELEGKVVVITGGNGFVGRSLGKKIVEEYKAKEVRLIDLNFKTFPPSLSPNLTLIQADITHLPSLLPHFKECWVVFHIASYGMSGKAMLQDSLVLQINVEGTKNVIKCCVENKVDKRKLFALLFNDSKTL